MLVPVRCPTTTFVGTEGACVSVHAAVVAVTFRPRRRFPRDRRRRHPARRASQRRGPLNVVVVWRGQRLGLARRYSPYPATAVSSVDGDQDIVRFVPAAATTLELPGSVGGMRVRRGPRGGIDDSDAGNDSRSRLRTRSSRISRRPCMTEAELVVAGREIQRRLERRGRVGRDHATRSPRTRRLRGRSRGHPPVGARLDDIGRLQRARPATRGRGCCPPPPPPPSRLGGRDMRRPPSGSPPYRRRRCRTGRSCRKSGC